MTIKIPDAPAKRTDRKTCSTCEASAAGCRSNEWLRGRRCCTACTGDHDLAHAHVETPNNHTNPAGASRA